MHDTLFLSDFFLKTGSLLQEINHKLEEQINPFFGVFKQLNL